MSDLAVLNLIVATLEANWQANANEQNNVLLQIQALDGNSNQDISSISSSGEEGSESYAYVTLSEKLQRLVEEGRTLFEQVAAAKRLCAESNRGIVRAPHSCYF